jgi:hypothetical protein
MEWKNRFLVVSRDGENDESNWMVRALLIDWRTEQFVYLTKWQVQRIMWNDLTSEGVKNLVDEINSDPQKKLL